MPIACIFSPGMIGINISAILSESKENIIIATMILTRLQRVKFANICLVSNHLRTTVSASIGGFDIVSSEIKDKDENLRLKSNGQITGSKVLFTAGKIAAWNLSGNNITSTGGGIRLNGNGNNAEISINSHTFGNEGIQLGFNSGNPRFYVGDGTWRYVEGPSVETNKWYHVLATFESRSVTSGIHSGVAKLFINGKLSQFKTLSYKPNSSTERPFRIGGGGDKDQNQSSDFNFIGGIDEVRL